MFRKIRSNRDPRDTVFSELRKEFKPHLHKTRIGLQTMLTRYPKTTFGLMVTGIALSAALSFTVFRHKENQAIKRKPAKVLSPVTSGIGQIMETSQAISEMLRLKKAIDSLSGKKQLTAGDSVTLEQALDRFQQLNKKFNQHEH